MILAVFLDTFLSNVPLYKGKVTAEIQSAIDLPSPCMKIEREVMFSSLEMLPHTLMDEDVRLQAFELYFLKKYENFFPWLPYIKYCLLGIVLE